MKVSFPLALEQMRRKPLSFSEREGVNNVQFIAIFPIERKTTFIFWVFSTCETSH